MPTNEANPIALAPDTWAHGDFGIELDVHLEVALEGRFGDRVRTSSAGVALEAINHGIEISLLRSLARCRDRSAVDGFMKDRVVGIVFLHGVEIVGTFEEMGALATRVLCANGLTVDALRRETLVERARVSKWRLRRERREGE